MWNSESKLRNYSLMAPIINPSQIEPFEIQGRTLGHSILTLQYSPKMVRHTLKILQHLLQGFFSVSDYFRTLCIKGLNLKICISYVK